MKNLKYISYLCLAAELLAPVLFYTGTLTDVQMKTTLLVATVGWFATATAWMNKPENT
jgi:hypothetical protein